jgi:hypothetical protein
VVHEPVVSDCGIVWLLTILRIIVVLIIIFEGSQDFLMILLIRYAAFNRIRMVAIIKVITT